MIALAERPATILPSEAAPVTDDGFPNVLSDPAPVAGLPRSASSIAKDVAAVDRQRQASQAKTASIGAAGSAAELARRARTHAEEARRIIEQSGRSEAVPQKDVSQPAIPE